MSFEYELRLADGELSEDASAELRAGVARLPGAESVGAAVTRERRRDLEDDHEWHEQAGAHAHSGQQQPIAVLARFLA